MIRYSFALSTSQSAANHVDRGRIPAAQSARKRGCGSFKQTVWDDAPDIDRRDGRHLLDRLLVLRLVRLNAPSIGLSILGQQLTEQAWRQRSGRYRCNTVPRQD